MRTFGVIAALLAVGCGSPDSKPSDTEEQTENTSTTGDTAPPDEPVIPWREAGAPTVAPPDFTGWTDGAPPVALPAFDCPEGWRAISDDDVGMVCDPWPDGGRQDCGSGEAHFPGEPGCRSVGAECPADGWPTGLPATGVWYVAEGGSGDGTSAASPLGGIGEALQRAGAGETIAVAAGTFAVDVDIGAEVTIRGACAAETWLVRTTGDPSEEIFGCGSTTDLTLQDLSLHSETGLALRQAGGRVRMEGVVIDGAVQNAIAVDSGTLQMLDVAIRNVAGEPSEGALGCGMQVHGAAMFEADGLSVSAVHEWGILLQGETEATLSRVEIHGLALGASGDRPAAIWIGENARLSLSSYVAESNAGGGIYAAAAATLDASDILVRKVASPDPDGVYAAVELRQEAIAVIDDLRIEAIDGDGIWIFGEGGYGPSVFASDVLIRDLTRSTSIGISAGDDAAIVSDRLRIVRVGADGIELLGGTAVLQDTAIVGVAQVDPYGVPLNVDGTVATVRRADIDSSGVVAVLVTVAGALEAEDLRVTGFGCLGGSPGAGLAVELGAAASISRVRLHGGVGDGIRVTIGSVEVADLLVENLAACDDGANGAGFSVLAGTLTGTRVELGGSRSMAIDAYGGVTTLSDLNLEADAGATGIEGRGIRVSGTAAVSLETARIDGARGYGVGVADSSARVALTDVAVLDTVQLACVASGECPDDTYATAVYSSGTATLERVLLDGGEGVGLQVDGGECVATDVASVANAVGINVIGGTLSETRVEATGNTTDRSTEALPHPE